MLMKSTHLKINYSNLSKQEINRKLFHLMALLLPAGVFYFPKFFGCPEWTFCFFLACLSIFIIGIEFFRLKFRLVQSYFYKYFKSLLRENEEKKITGSTWYIIAAFACSLLFYGAPHISFMALFMFIVGDAAAAIIGLSIGRIKIGEKSLEGALGCFTFCVFTGIAVFPNMPLLLGAWDGHVPFGLIITVSFIMTVSELIPIRLTNHFTLNDNLATPIMGGLSLQFLHPFFMS